MRTLCKSTETEDGVRIKFRTDGKIQYQEVKFTNYFYIKAEEFDQVSYLVLPKAKSIKTVTDRNNEDYVKIFMKNNFHRNMLRNDLEDTGVRTYEADINAPKRMLIDNPDFALNQEGLRIAFYDIETDDRKPFVKDKKGEIVPVTPITSIAVKEFMRDGEGEVWYARNEGLDGEEFNGYREIRQELIDLQNKELPTKDVHLRMAEWDDRVWEALFSGEKVLLEKYYDHIRDFDVISAWNGSKFDDSYVRFRSQKHKLNYEGLQLVGFDYEESYKKNHYGAVKSFKLNDVAFQELKSEMDKEGSSLAHPEEIQKLDWKEITKASKYFDMFLLFPEVHKEYNIQDVQLLDMMEKKLGFFKLHYVQCLKAHCLLIDTLYNSRICDMLVLNESKKRKIIKISKPTEQEVKNREKKIPPGGFTFCYEPGLHWSVLVFDFASHYVNVIRTFNISPENYIRSEMPDLSKVFTPNEVMFIEFAVEQAPSFVDEKNTLKKKKYEDCIEEKRVELEVDNMEKLMWKFIKKYDNKIEHKDSECFTPADINYDTRGWNVHPHFVFGNTERAIYPTILDDSILERDRVKYTLDDYEYLSFEWQEKNYYQLGLKLLGNSLYGFTGFRGSRDYMFEIPTSITTSARYLTKICMVEAWDNDMTITHGDTDSSYMTSEEEDIEKVKTKMDSAFENMLDKKIPAFNTMKFQDKVHTVNFEFEELYTAMIPIKKKRYYYMKESGKIDGKGGSQTRSDVLTIAKDIQKELLFDIFNKKFDKEAWKVKLLDLKNTVKEYKLEEKHIIRISGLGKPVEQYGKPVVDGSTGLQKLRKSDGQPMFAPIPANVQIAKRLMEEGENVDVGDKIPFVVLESKPKIKPITVKEYREQKKYDTNYYYEKIIKPVLEILMVTHSVDVYTHFKDCWLYTERQLKSLQKKFEDEEEK